MPLGTPLKTYAAARREVPAANLLDLGGRQVHVEQSGEGPPLVLLHGFGASSYSWRLVLPALARSYRIIAPDLHGFGHTERPRDLASYTRDGQADLVLAILDALGIDRAHLVGHSYGGSISLWLATHHPSRVRSLTLVDSAAPTFPNDRRTRLARVRPLAWLFLHGVALTRRAVQAALEGSIHDRSQITPELVDAYRDRLRVEGADAAFRGLTMPLSTPERTEVDFARIEQPTLAVWGTEDRLVRVEDGRRAVARMPRASFVELAGIGHMPMEECPEELVRILTGFLALQEKA